MTENQNYWTVLNADADAAVLVATYSFGPNGEANCFVAKMKSGGLVVVSPSVGLTDAGAAQLEAYGPVEALVAPNGFHHLGQTEWQARYPEARAFAPSEAHGRIAKKGAAGLAFEPLSALQPLLGDDVAVVEVPNTKCGEVFAWARTSTGHVWFTSDILANMPALPPKFPIRQMFKWTGSAPGFRPFGLALKFIVKDKNAVLRQVREEMKAHPPHIIVPGHGDLLDRPGIADEAQALLEAY